MATPISLCFILKMTKEIEYIVSETGCHECISHCKGTGGYPKIVRNGRVQRLHRVIYAATYGDVPVGLVVRHTCDNPACINPAHLILGTHQQNVQDRVLRGRSAKGEKINNAKLTTNDVIMIRSAAFDHLSNTELSKLFNVCRQNIYNVRKRISWRDVT